MKHPTPEEWMAFLYWEDEASRRSELQAHAGNCRECSAYLRAWAGGKRFLDDWPAGASRRPRPNWLLPAKLAAAAVLMLGAGVCIGRFIPRPSAELARFKAEILREFDQRLATAVSSTGSEMQHAIVGLAKLQDERLSNDREALLGALHKLDAGYSAQLANLRSELETVAVNTEDGLLETHEKLGLLASSAQSARNSPQ